MKRRHLKLIVLPAALAFIGAIAFGQWFHLQRRQYWLNRQLIAALVANDGKRALSLVNSGADPNTHFNPPPKPTLRNLWDKLRHRLPPPDDSPTAFLIACGEDCTPEAGHQYSPIPTMDAPRLIEAMLVHGAYIGVKDGESTPIYAAVYHHRFRTVQLLIERGAAPLEPTNGAQSLLCLAAENGELAVVHSLLKHGAKVDGPLDGAYTPLQEAINHTGNLNIIRELLEHGANPNCSSDDGATAMSLALYDNQTDVIKLLKKFGAKGSWRRPAWRVPAIARILDVRMGYNGQDALQRRLGEPMASIGGHPRGNKLWNISDPPGSVSTDGFPWNEEGLVLEDLNWELSRSDSARIPLVPHLAPHSGWLGVIYPGMSMTQVSDLIKGRVAAPKKRGNTWYWSAPGYVKPNAENSDVYTTWTAELTFQAGTLTEIKVGCH